MPPPAAPAVSAQKKKSHLLALNTGLAKATTSKLWKSKLTAD